MLVFFEYILVSSKSMEEHAEHLRLAMEVSKKINFVLRKRSKCEFGATQIEYLGHVISREGVATDPKKIEVMSQWPVPRKVKEFRGLD